MKTKLLLFVATSLAIAASAPTFAAGTSSPFDAKSAAPLTLATTYADAPVNPVLSTIAAINIKVDFQGISGAKSLVGDPDWKTISARAGVIDDGPATLKPVLVNGSAQGGSGFGCATTSLAADAGSGTAAPAIGYSVTDLAKLIKPERSAASFITA